MKEIVIFVFLGFLAMVSCEGTELSGTDNHREGKFAFLSGATNMISTLAQDLLSRSTTSSQVLSLNLTNLVILFVLKAIIFGASSFGYGYGSGSHGRSSDNIAGANMIKEVKSKSFLTEAELLFLLTFLQADSLQKYDCLHRLACEDPTKAKEYLLAGKIFFKGAKFMTSSLDESKYSHILSGLQEAVSYGLNDQNCSEKYHCDHKYSLTARH